MELDVRYLDNHLLVVNKPPGLLSQADATGDLDLLTAAKAYLKQQFQKPGNVYVGLVHRLDRPASGVMVLARTSKAAARLAEQFRGSSPRKQYLVLVEGTCRGSDTCTDYLCKEDGRVRIVSAAQAGARHAELSWVAHDSRNGLSLLTVTLKTGRPHQIRAQLAARGLPVLGDLRYGAHREFDGRNLALHCYLLAVRHPVSRQELCFTAAPPGSWQGFFDACIQNIMAEAT